MLLPLSQQWAGTLSSDPAKRVNNTYVAPIGWRGKALSLHASIVPDAAATAASMMYVAVGAAGAVCTSPVLNSAVPFTAQVVIPGATWVDSAYANGVFIIVGTGGNVAFTTNGTTWTPSVLGVNDFKAVTFSGTVFCAVGKGGTIYTCTNGTDWAVRTSGVATDLNCVFFNGNNLVIAGLAGVILTADYLGVTWTARTSGVVTDLNSVGKERISRRTCVVGAAGVILTSDPTLVTWTVRVSATVEDLLSVSGTDTGEAGIVAVGKNGTILTSADAITWSGAASAAGPDILKVAFAKDARWYAITTATVKRSTNGTAWTTTTYPAGSYSGDNGYGNISGPLAIMGPAGSLFTQEAYTAGPTKTLNSGTASILYSFAAGLVNVSPAVGGALAVGQTQFATVSGDNQWNVRNTVTIAANCICQMPAGLFVAVGDSNAIYKSLDGITWIRRDVVGPAQLIGVCYGAGLFVAVGGGGGGVGVVYTSVDGETWEYSDPATAQRLNSVTYSAILGLYVAAGNGGVILTSPNGKVWTPRTSGTLVGLNFVYARPDGGLIACGVAGAIIYSANAIAWLSALAGEASGTLYCTAYGAGVFVIVGAGAEIFRSIDNGLTWVKVADLPPANMYGINWCTDRFIAVGSAGAAYQSTNGKDWTSFTSVVTSSLYSLVPWGAPTSNRPFIQLIKNGVRDLASESFPLYLVTSPGGPGYPKPLRASGMPIGWLIQSGEINELVLDYQRNNFVGTVAFVVDIIYGPVEGAR